MASGACSVRGAWMRPGNQAAAPVPLPSLDGVGPSCIALPPGPWPTVVDFLAERFPRVGRAEWLARMARGHVVEDGGITVHAGTLYRPHRKLYYYRHLPAEARIPFEAVLLFRDEHLVVVDKPHFLPVTPGGRYLQETLLVRLKQALGIDTLTPLHRLDRETAGLVLLSLRPQDRDAYHALFRERAVYKSYEAIAPWRSDLSWPVVRRSRLAEAASFMQACEVAGEPNAETRIDCLEVRGDLARYRLEPATGQRHQLRVHMAALGLPLRHDLIYPDLQPALAPGVEPDYRRPLQLLAKTLAFRDPVTGQARRFESQRQLSWE